MRFSSLCIGFAAVVVSTGQMFAAEVAAVATVPNEASVKKFEAAVASTENLQLPLNKVVLYRQAAVALIATDKPRAVALLKVGLADIDAAEVAMKAQKPVDELQKAQYDKTYAQLEFHRLPVIMLMERIDPAEALNVLRPPQTADRDTAFQTMFFKRLKNPELVRESAQQKLDYGASPAVVAAYEVLQKESPGAARSLATAMVLKLAKTDPAEDPIAVQAAFGLLRLLRTDIGSLAPVMVLNPDLVSGDTVRELFNFIGDAFVASKDPEMLILGERPGVYVGALEQYAPDKAQEVKLLPFAAPDAKSLIMSPEKPVVDLNHPDPATLTPEQVQQRAAMKAQIAAQMKETDAEMARLGAKVKDVALTQKEREAALSGVVEQANKAISLARSGATALDREAFRDGEVELYNLGSVTHVVDTASAVLQAYAKENPKVAEEAARNLDGREVQTEVALQLAIREMTGGPAYLVPPAKPPVGVRAGAAVNGGAPGAGGAPLLR